MIYSRGTSTKTRIETIIHFFTLFAISIIREAHPLKQGLKLRLDNADRVLKPIFERHIH